MPLGLLADLTSSSHEACSIELAPSPADLPPREPSRDPPQEPARERPHLIVRSIGRAERVELDTIEWVVAAGNYVELRVAGRTLLHREPLHSIEQRLDPTLFVRIHRSAIVRRTSVREIRTVGHGYHVVVCDVRSFRVSRTYRSAISQLTGRARAGNASIQS